MSARFVGIDFSGAQDAGRKIWIAEGVESQGRVQIRSLLAAKHLPGSGIALEPALAALQKYLLALPPGSTVGLDFPFGVAESHMEGQQSWQSYVQKFATLYDSPEAFRARCRELDAGHETKRLCDVLARTPFAPHNLWLFKQTYYGIRAVVAPLLASGKACFPPMTTLDDTKIALLETCPASFLKAEGLARPYKGRSAERRRARAALLTALAAYPLRIPKELRAQAIADSEGDALDALLCALCAFRARQNPALPRAEHGPFRKEAKVFF